MADMKKVYDDLIIINLYQNTNFSWKMYFWHKVEDLATQL